MEQIDGDVVQTTDSIRTGQPLSLRCKTQVTTLEFGLLWQLLKSEWIHPKGRDEQ